MIIVPIWALLLVFVLTPVWVIWNLAYYGFSAEPAGYIWGALASVAWATCAVNIWRRFRFGR